MPDQIAGLGRGSVVAGDGRPEPYEKYWQGIFFDRLLALPCGHRRVVQAETDGKILSIIKLKNL